MASIFRSVSSHPALAAFGEGRPEQTYGIVDEIARRALLTGARVLGVRQNDIPNGAPLAATLRYPV